MFFPLQQSFIELTNRVESFTNGYLANIDSSPTDHQPNRARMRDQLRTKLTSQPFFFHQINDIINQLLKESNIASDVIDEIETKTRRLLGVVEPTEQKATTTTICKTEEQMVDVDEGADMSVPCDTSSIAVAVDDISEQNMDIDSDDNAVAVSILCLNIYVKFDVF